MADVVVRTVGRVGHITLNRPAAINALTLAMAVEIDGMLQAWETDADIECVLLTGAGPRGFCAGGDIVHERDWILAGKLESAQAFWRAEYALDARIARYPKPFVVVMHGIVMGGGVGLACHARHRLVTNSAAIAMPEVSIGLAPDVGGTYLLSRAPGEIGMHLALTGRTVDAEDAIACGLADALLPEPDTDVAALLNQLGPQGLLADLPAPAAGKLTAAREWIDDAYAGGSVEEIVTRLRGRGERDAQSAAADIGRNAPIALKVTHEAMRRARRMSSLEECLEQDYRVTSRFFSTPDLGEGIRAAVIDKDRKPRWQPAELAAVGREQVEGYFAPLDHDLGLASDLYP